MEKNRRRFNELTKNNTNEFERFIKDYITIKSHGNIPKNKDIYRKFKQVRNNFERNVEELVKEMLQYARYYFKIINQKEEDEKLRQALMSLNNFDFKVTRPLLLNLYHDYDNAQLSKEDFISIIEIIESYVIRRNLCSYNTNILNNIFSRIYYTLDKNRYLESFKIELMLLEDKKMFPNDTEIRENLKTLNLYGNDKCYDILEKIENYGDKEKFVSIYPSVEHILPQNKNLSKAWQDNLGSDWREIQEKYVHTIGNLTITGNNSELGDKSFEDKKYMERGYEHSKSKLTQSLLKYDTWNQNTIEERTDELTNIIIHNIWKYPKVDELKLKEAKDLKENKSKDKIVTHNNNETIHKEYWTIIKEKIIKKGFKTRSVRAWNTFSLSKNKKSKFTLGLILSKKKISFELFINDPKKELYAYLLKQKNEINNEFGDIECKWIENPKSSKIITYTSIDVNDKNNWNEAMRWHLDMLDKFNEVFTKRINDF